MDKSPLSLDDRFALVTEAEEALTPEQVDAFRCRLILQLLLEVSDRKKLETMIALSRPDSTSEERHPASSVR
ncbi:MAG: hypothetical protein V2I43_06520 [Parvularcula sp.]|jgi:hypothetical protein|nr:hypothetical protein [Parvularcula sp.]